MNAVKVDLQDRYREFGRELDAIHKRVRAEMGEEDVRYVKRLNRFSRVMEAVGRVLIHVSFEPVSFGTGVLALWVHKQLQTTEIGHTVLHGAYDRLEGAERFQSKSFQWDIPIDEESWRRGHNIDHHQYTNVAGKDPDIHYGFVRLTEQTPYHPVQAWTMPYTFLVAFPNFGLAMNMHFTGLIDYHGGNGLETEFDFIKDRSKKTRNEVYRRFLRKTIPYYAKNFLFYPALAGPFFWKVLLGNWLADTIRDVYTAATIYCGHVGEDVADYPMGTKATGKGHWYAMQVESSNSFKVPKVLSILCGGLDLQIEHHLFPKLPPHRLRQISAEVQASCERHGVSYRKEGWGKTFGKAVRRIWRLSRGQKSGLRSLKAVVNGMA
jgi:linoleoyl-CoA desaturase